MWTWLIDWLLLFTAEHAETAEKKYRIDFAGSAVPVVNKDLLRWTRERLKKVGG